MICVFMTSPVPERERQRLAELYSAKSDDELRRLAEDSGELSEPALLALSAELRRRGLKVPVAEPAVDMKEIQQRKLVVIEQFREPQPALLLKGLLESAGIETFLVDENMIRMDWFYSTLLGGVKLAVAEEDAEAAREILSQPVPESFEVEGVGAFQQPRCLKCGSVEISHQSSVDKTIGLASLFVGVPIPVPRDVWKCAACGAYWTGESDGAPAGAEL